MADQQIGTVVLDRLRAYPRPGHEDDRDSDVGVEAGTYPVYRRPDGTAYWAMTGRPGTWHQGKLDKIGDGLFLGVPAHFAIDRSAAPVEVRSGSFDRDELADAIAHPPRREDGTYCYVVTLFAGVTP